MAGFRITNTLLLALALAAGAASVLVEGARNLAGHHATRAARLLTANQPAPAVESAASALAWFPYQEAAQYTQLAAWKRMEMWDPLAETARRVSAWHPDQTLLLQLAGEANWRRGDLPAAVRNLWAALWRTPYPPQTPAQVWRVALMTGRQVWGGGDARNAAAAVKVLSLLDQDVTMANPAIRRQATGEALEALRAAGAPLTANALGQP